MTLGMLFSKFINSEALLVYCQLLGALNSDCTQRFEDILNMDIPEWVLDTSLRINIEESQKLQKGLTIN